MSFNFQTGDPYTDVTTQEATQPQDGIKDLYSQANPQVSMDFESSALSPKLRTLGIDTHGINFSPVGRMQLLSRLQQNIGDDYMNHPVTKELISSFDGLTKMQNMDGQKSYIEQQSKAQKTLEALYKV